MRIEMRRSIELSICVSSRSPRAIFESGRFAYLDNIFLVRFTIIDTNGEHDYLKICGNQKRWSGYIILVICRRLKQNTFFSLELNTTVTNVLIVTYIYSS